MSAGLWIGTLASSGAVAAGDFRAIATAVVGTNSPQEVTFSNIPQTFRHLQVRMLTQQGSGTSTPTAGQNIYLLARINNLGGTNFYTGHALNGVWPGSSTVWPNAENFPSASYDNMYVGYSIVNTNASASFGAHVMDILDYSSTTKNKTIRTFGGWGNVSNPGAVGLFSNVALTNQAITTLSIRANVPAGRTFNQNTHIALYGILAP